MASTGQSPAVILSDWDLPMIREMNAYWRTNPPVHLLVKLFMGYRGKDGEVHTATEEELQSAERIEDALDQTYVEGDLDRLRELALSTPAEF